MASQRDARSFHIHFEPFDCDQTDQHALPAPVLIETISQIQRIVYLLAKMRRGEPLGQRAAFSQTLRDEFALLCHVPEPASYAVPFEIGNPSLSSEVPDITGVGHLFHRLTRAVGAGNTAAIHEFVPDPRYLDFLTDAYRKAQPSPRSGLSLSIEDSRRHRILDGRQVHNALSGLTSTSRVNTCMSQDTISGLIVGMNFDKHSVRLQRPDGKILTVGYDGDSERPLIDHRRDWIQVTGDVVYDVDYQPISVKHAHDFVAVDEDDIELGDISFHDVPYRAEPPLRFTVTYDPADQLYDLVGEFDISLSADSRPQLIRDLNEELSVLWLEYAEESPDRLSPKARSLRVQLLGRLQAG